MYIVSHSENCPKRVSASFSEFLWITDGAAGGACRTLGAGAIFNCCYTIWVRFGSRNIHIALKLCYSDSLL
jgi:hypothetical protein